MIIVLDGPAASGKSTVARELAKRLKANYLDTGAIYRAITWKALKNGIDTQDELALERLAKSSDIQIAGKITDGIQSKVFIDGEDVSDKIRMPEVSANVSNVSKFTGVRKALLPIQREVAEAGDLVADGRDLGTVVFPDAELKIFLTASAVERAKRRRRDLLVGGHKVKLKELERLIARRDAMDSSRTISPLVKAKDAKSINTTGKTVDEVVDAIIKLTKVKSG
jgi:cytidylate kinase